MRISAIKAAILGMALAWLGPQVQAQQAVSLLALSEILTQSQSDPQGAAARIDDLLPQVPQENVRLIYDLFALKAELLEQLDQDAEAAQLYAQLAQFAGANREQLHVDPVPLWARAAQLFEATGDLRTAREARLDMLAVQQDGGAQDAALQPNLDKIAALSAALGDEVNIPSDLGQSNGGGSNFTAFRSVEEDSGYQEIDVYYATDRARSGEADPNGFYGYARGPLELGVARVTIPATHQPGVIDAPSIWRLEFGANPAKHVVLQSVTPVAEDDFYARMNMQLAQTEASSAFVFIHGYNVSFDQAARRAAQIAYDMTFPGVPVLYSWPSRGSTAGYIADTAVVRLSGRRLSHFLDDLVERSGATTIHIVAHSMGNRALTDALELLALRRGVQDGDPPIFDQVLFAAPDVDADLFAEMMPTIRPVAKRLTLYASEQDWALATSKQLHGDAPRAGQGGADMIARPEFDSVDMSQLGDDMLAHSYFADDSSALADMVALFWRNAAPELRCGLEAVTLEGRDRPIWQYLAGSCADRTLVEVLAHLQSAQVNDARTAEKVVNETVTDPDAATILRPVVIKLFGD